ncbi:hypothetical protein [Tautonia rosea]|uniref:hypothetical protein n=1 Tax=Tautonia rosea TaxID=2728037 RepID=UPI0014745847|nr:hypothetical protein [Tautonia rosea]
MSTPTDSPESTPTPTTPPVAPVPEASASPTKTKAKVSPARNAISMVLLIVLLIVGGLELNALFQFNSAVDRLDKALESNEDDLLPLTQVEEILGKKPDGPLQDDQPGMQSTTYTWRGAIRSHVLVGFYSYGDAPGMVKYEIGSAVATDPGGD